MNEAQKATDPIVFFKPTTSDEKSNVTDEVAKTAQTLQKYKHQMKQIREQHQ